MAYVFLSQRSHGSSLIGSLIEALRAAVAMDLGSGFNTTDHSEDTFYKLLTSTEVYYDSRITYWGSMSNKFTESILYSKVPGKHDMLLL